MYNRYVWRLIVHIFLHVFYLNIFKGENLENGGQLQCQFLFSPSTFLREYHNYTIAKLVNFAGEKLKIQQLNDVKLKGEKISVETKILKWWQICTYISINGFQIAKSESRNNCLYAMRSTIVRVLRSSLIYRGWDFIFPVL